MMERRLDDILEHLRDAGSHTAATFRALRPEDWQVVVQDEGAGWRVRDILAHFVTIEASMHRLFEDMLTGGAGSPPDFDLDRFNASQTAKIAHLPPEKLVERFETVRARTIEIVAGIRPADLDRVGRHAFLGEDNLERFIRWAYEHTALHEAEVRAALDTSHPTS
jgi:Mycothiol maleylpyruvate isomerase N-terminal domain